MARFEDGAWRGLWIASFSCDYFDGMPLTPDGERPLFFSSVNRGDATRGHDVYRAPRAVGGCQNEGTQNTPFELET